MPYRASGQPLNVFVSEWEDAPARLPPGLGVWAIGDVHGQLAQLEALLGAVRGLMDGSPPGPRHLVLMGDYIDRGPDNLAALERAGTLGIEGVTVTALRGNHEDYLDRFLNDEGVGEDLVANWIVNGGDATLANLGVGENDIRDLGAAAVARAVRTQPMPVLREALDRLQIGLRLGGYFFVHAGVHPGFRWTTLASASPPSASPSWPERGGSTTSPSCTAIPSPGRTSPRTASPSTAAYSGPAC